MENTQNEAMMQKIERTQVSRTSSKKPLIFLGILLAGLLAAYLGLCVYATGCKTIWKGTEILGQDVGGLTVTEAAKKIESALPNLSIRVYLFDDSQQPADRAEKPDATIAVSDLGAKVDGKAAAQEAYDYNVKDRSFLTAGWRYLINPGVIQGVTHVLTVDETKASSVASTLADTLSWPAQDTRYELSDDAVIVTTAQDGRQVSAADFTSQLTEISWASDLGLDVPYTVESAQRLSAQDLSDEVSGEMKNAGYDPATKSITAEQVGVEFDVNDAQKLLDKAEPGTVVEVPATIEQPTVTAEQLKAVLFRDVLGSAATHVGGTSARISNVKLASSTLNGTVLNSGETFSYNNTVGQRTETKGYQAAPAYVQGETVDEIGGGVCQPSSTLYLACLRSNLEIVKRAAHRYVPAYIAKGMDATVSWGGPDYQFKNNTDYPIKIAATYSKGYLTMTLYGTKTDDTYVKMTNKVLSTTNYTVVHQEDSSLAPGTRQIKVTPYTGYKVESYRNLYHGDGTLITSKLEAVSDYKVRNEIILVGPKKVETPANSSSSSGTTPEETTTPVTQNPTEEAPAQEETPNPSEETPTQEETPTSTGDMQTETPSGDTPA